MYLVRTGEMSGSTQTSLMITGQDRLLMPSKTGFFTSLTALKMTIWIQIRDWIQTSLIDKLIWCTIEVTLKWLTGDRLMEIHSVSPFQTQTVVERKHLLEIARTAAWVKISQWSSLSRLTMSSGSDSMTWQVSPLLPGNYFIRMSETLQLTAILLITNLMNKNAGPKTTDRVQG